MVTILTECTIKEQRAVVRFLWAKGLPAKDIHKEMLPVYADKCLSRKAVHSWVEKFSQGRSKIVDEFRSGRPIEIATEASVQRVKEMIRGDRRVTIDSVASAIGCSHGSAYRIMHDRLQFKKVCSRMQDNQVSMRPSRLLQRNSIDQHDEIRLKQQMSKTVSRRKRKVESQDDKPGLSIEEPVNKLNCTKSETSQISNTSDVQKRNKRTTIQQKRSVKRNSEIHQSANSTEPDKHKPDLLQSQQTVSDIDLLAKYKERLEALKKYNVGNSIPVFEKLCLRYEELKNDSKAAGMSKYMRNKFVYFGIATPERRASCTDLWTEVKTLSPDDLRTLALQTWNSPEREFHYFTTELLQREIFRIYEDEDLTTGDLAVKTLDFVKSFIDHPSSWWDTVDCLSPNVVGPLVQKYPNELLPEMDKWNKSSCFWVCRASILYQLSYKKDTDADRLFRYCLQVAEEEEFFIRKAIGWALRQYYRIDPKAVREFVLKHKSKLSPLSVKEALKHDKKHS